MVSRAAVVLGRGALGLQTSVSDQRVLSKVGKLIEFYPKVKQLNWKLLLPLLLLLPSPDSSTTGIHVGSMCFR